MGANHVKGCHKRDVARVCAVIGMGFSFFISGQQKALADCAPGACSVNDPNHYTCLTVRNNYDHHVLVKVDGNYACDADAGTYCTAVITIDHHEFEAITDNGKHILKSGWVGANGVCWALWVKQ